jgi:hypothetical protein
MFSAMQWIGIFLFFLPLFGFCADHEFTLPGCKGSVDASCYEQRRKEISFITTAPIHVCCSYPVFSGAGSLVKYANQHLRRKAENCFNCYQKNGSLKSRGSLESPLLSGPFY